MSKFYQILAALAMIGILLILAGNGAAVSLVLHERLLLCLHTLVPSLFACMATANLLMESGAAAKLGGILCIPMRRLGWNAEIAGIFLLSQLAGYPVGAVLLRRMTEEKRLSPADADRLRLVCFGGGPSFAVGLVGAQVFGSAAIGWMLLFCGTAANLCLACVMRPSKPLSPIFFADAPCFSVPAAFTRSVADAMRGLYGICGIVLAFGVVTWLLNAFKIMHLLAKCGTLFNIPTHQTQRFLAAVLDITQISALCQSGLSCRAAIPLATGLLSFGGICVLLQCTAFGSAECSFLRLMAARIFAGILAAGFAWLLLPLFGKNSAAAVFSAVPKLSESESVLPSFFILLTGFPLLLKKDWTNRRFCVIMKKNPHMR